MNLGTGYCFLPPGWRGRPVAVLPAPPSRSAQGSSVAAMMHEARSGKVALLRDAAHLFAMARHAPATGDTSGIHRRAGRWRTQATAIALIADAL